MKYAIVVLHQDLERLQSSKYKKMLEASFICSELKLIEKLQVAEQIIFVISEIAMCSTRYQEIILSAIEVTKNIPHRVLKLDKTRIPIGLQPLQTLQEITEEMF